MTKLKRWRKGANLSREHVRDRLKEAGHTVSTAAIGRWERGERHPATWALAKEVSTVTGGVVSVEDLMTAQAESAA